MSHTHYYPILLPVTGMQETGPVGLTREKVAEALSDMARLVLEASPEQLREIIGRDPVSTYPEDSWVLRPIDRPNMIYRADGGAESVRYEDIRPQDKLNSAEISARNIRPFSDAIWSRPENLGGTPVLMSVSGDQGEIGRIDIRDWLAWTGDDEIMFLAENGWNMEAAASLAMSEHAEGEDPLATEPLLVSCRDRGVVPVCVVDPEYRQTARAFLAELRPGLLEREEPSP